MVLHYVILAASRKLCPHSNLKMLDAVVHTVSQQYVANLFSSCMRVVRNAFHNSFIPGESVCTTELLQT